MIKKRISLLAFALVLGASFSSATPAKAAPTEVTTSEAASKVATKAKLTVMVYSDGDNNLEEYLLNDIQEMKNGYVENPNLNLIVLADRAPGYSSNSTILGSNFTDTRLFKIGKGTATRISGGTYFPEITKTSTYEANMGDANTLKKFIDSTKAQYPAEKYALIISNHGGGARDNKNIKTSKAVCWDDTNGEDTIYTAELSDTLTSDESVDLLAYDACLMGTSEIAYQYRPGNGSFEAKVMVASPPTVWGNGYDYKRIFSRLKAGGRNNGQVDSTVGGKELYLDPATVTPLQLGAAMVEAQRDSVTAGSDTSQVLSVYDLTKISAVKTAVDNLSVALSKENEKADIEALRGTGSNVSLIHYFTASDKSEWLDYPYFDLYDFAKKISTSTAFSANVKALATNVMTATDNLIAYSYGGSDYAGFTEGKSGISLFIPDGSKSYYDSNSGTSIPSWKAQRWYNAIDTTTIDPEFLYGKLSWCIDGKTPTTSNIGNWFELLDSWFDTSNTSAGGFNGYQW